MGRRAYNSNIGRFDSPDPIFEGSANAYDYVNQNPVTGSDLSGETTEPPNGGGSGGHWVLTTLWVRVRVGGSCSHETCHLYAGNGGTSLSPISGQFFGSWWLMD